MTFNYDWLREFPYWTLDDAVDTATSEFPHAWRDYWGIGASECPEHLEPHEWDLANEMHDMARRIYAVAATLHGGLPDHLKTLPPILDQESKSERKSRREVADMLRDHLKREGGTATELVDIIRWLDFEEGPAEAKEKLFRTALQLHAYPDFGCPPGPLAARILDLLDYLVRASGERTREYLRRVATCYVRDMSPEMAVMSRAVMEAALDFPLLEERVEMELKVKGKRHPGLGDWIDAACSARVLDERGRIAADTVKTAGDDAVHNVPQAVPDPESILKALSVVLTQIERFRKGQR